MKVPQELPYAMMSPSCSRVLRCVKPMLPHRPPRSPSPPNKRPRPAIDDTALADMISEGYQRHLEEYNGKKKETEWNKQDHEELRIVMARQLLHDVFPDLLSKNLSRLELNDRIDYAFQREGVCFWTANSRKHYSEMLATVVLMLKGNADLEKKQQEMAERKKRESKAPVQQMPFPQPAEYPSMSYDTKVMYWMDEMGYWHSYPEEFYGCESYTEEEGAEEEWYTEEEGAEEEWYTEEEGAEEESYIEEEGTEEETTRNDYYIETIADLERDEDADDEASDY